MRESLPEIRQLSEWTCLRLMLSGTTACGQKHEPVLKQCNRERHNINLAGKQQIENSISMEIQCYSATHINQKLRLETVN